MTLSNITMIICTMHDLHHIILCITSSSCQAVVFPSAMSKLMDGTQISKARMLGGKLGKKVMSLLPESETTMGSISRLLPLDRLEKAIGVESGRWVFDACRGIDFEEVKATLKVLLKSITVSTLCKMGVAITQT